MPLHADSRRVERVASNPLLHLAERFGFIDVQRTAVVGERPSGKQPPTFEEGAEILTVSGEDRCDRLLVPVVFDDCRVFQRISSGWMEGERPVAVRGKPDDA